MEVYHLKTTKDLIMVNQINTNKISMEDLTETFKEDLNNKIMEHHKEDLQRLGTASFAK